MRPLVAGAWAEVVPLREGGGSRLKVLEALALGTPVVATAKGVEGLDLVPGRDFLLADEADDFARRTLELLGDRGLRDRLSVAGGAQVAATADWGPITERFVDLVTETAGARAAA